MEENSGMWLRLAGRVYREDISMVYEAVEGLVQYGLDKGLISEVDAVYARNQILDVMGMDEYEEPQGPVESGDLEAILRSFWTALPARVCLRRTVWFTGTFLTRS